MANRYGFGLRLGIGVEVTFGSAVSRNRFFRLASGSMRSKPNWNRRPLISSGPNAQKMSKGMTIVDGDIECLASYEGMGVLYAFALGSSSSSGSGPYTHTYVLSRTLPSTSMEVVSDNENVCELYTGVMCSKASWSVKAGETMKFKLSLMAEDELQEQTATSPTYTTNDGDVDVEHHQAGSVSWNSGTYSVYSAEITLDNKLARREKLGSVASKSFVRSDFLEVLIKLELDWEGGFNAAWVAGTKSDLSLTFTGGSNTLTFNVHNAMVIDEGHPINIAGVIKQTVTLRGLSDGTDEGLAIVVVNGQSTATAQ